MNQQFENLESVREKFRKKYVVEFSAGKVVRVIIWALFLSFAGVFLGLLLLAEVTGGRPVPGSALAGVMVLWMACYAIAEMTK